MLNRNPIVALSITREELLCRTARLELVAFSMLNRAILVAYHHGPELSRS